MIEIERLAFSDCELRAEGGDKPKLIGYAAVFNVLSEDMGFGSWERIAPGAFKRSLAGNPDVRATIEHHGGLDTIGRTRAKTLELVEDDRGLKATIFPPDTSAGRDVVSLVSRGELRGMSFAFRLLRDKDGNSLGDRVVVERGKRIREVFDVDLLDVTITAMPMYPQTSISKRSQDLLRQADEADAEIERDFRKRRLDLCRIVV